MALALVNVRIVADREIGEGQAVLIDGERVAAIVPDDQVPAGSERRNLQGAILAAGFIDVQVNGGGGRLFNDDPSVDTIAAIGASGPPASCRH